MTHWKYFTPFTCIHPNPVYSWTTPCSFWVLVAVGLVGFLAGASEAIRGDSRTMPPLLISIIVPASLSLLAYSWRIRREEWVAFPTEMDGIWVRYCRAGPDRARFDEFTVQLTERIQESQPWNAILAKGGSGAPTSLRSPET